jgi:oligopeptide/dipeptide ABC transporter ATP-binding protein
VSIQAQILNLLKDLREELNLTLLFIAHDLGVVEYISDRVAVMYLGRIVEIADAVELYKNAKHPYTQALMSAIPSMDPMRRSRRIVLKGDVPSPARVPPGCPFHTRCPEAMPKCSEIEPPIEQVGTGHMVACWLHAASPATKLPERAGER